MRALALVLLTAAPANAQVSQGSAALLRGLDKIDGRTADLEVGVGETAAFGSLRITLAECRYPAENPSGNAFAWLDIAQDGVRLFDGWMIASSPALNALDHPRYDVWVIGCET